MKYRSIMYFIVGIWLANTLNLDAAEQRPPDSELQKLFATALNSCDEEYQKIRTTIITHENASAFLIEQAQSTNLMVRVIGRAMLSWQNNSETNLIVNARYTERTRFLLMSHVGKSQVLSEIYDIKSMPRKFRFKDDPYIILEIALKGRTFLENSWASKYSQRRFFIRCYAAGMSGRYDDPDIIPVLTHLTDEDEDDFMRESALLGLRLREDSDIAVFLKGLTDRSEEYRDTAYREMRDITSQDFGYNPEKYRIWLETNTVERAALPVK